MNPITRELERFGWTWNSRSNTYVYKNNSKISIPYKDLADIPLNRLEQELKKTISEYKKKEKENVYRG